MRRPRPARGRRRAEGGAREARRGEPAREKTRRGGSHGEVPEVVLRRSEVYEGARAARGKGKEKAPARASAASRFSAAPKPKSSADARRVAAFLREANAFAERRPRDKANLAAEEKSSFVASRPRRGGGGGVVNGWLGVTPPPVPGSTYEPATVAVLYPSSGREDAHVAGVARGAEIATRRERVRLGLPPGERLEKKTLEDRLARVADALARVGSRLGSGFLGAASTASHASSASFGGGHSSAYLGRGDAGGGDGARIGLEREREVLVAAFRIVTCADDRRALGARRRPPRRSRRGRTRTGRTIPGRVSGTRRSRSARGTPRARRRARPPRSCGGPRTRSSPSRAWRRKTQLSKTQLSRARARRGAAWTPRRAERNGISAQRRGRARRRRRRLGRRRVRRNHRVRGARRRGRARGGRAAAPCASAAAAAEEEKGAVFATEAVRAACRRTHEFVDRTDRTAGADGNGVGAAVWRVAGRTRRWSRGTRARRRW